MGKIDVSLNLNVSNGGDTKKLKEGSKRLNDNAHVKQSDESRRKKLNDSAHVKLRDEDGRKSDDKPYVRRSD